MCKWVNVYVYVYICWRNEMKWMGNIRILMKLSVKFSQLHFWLLLLCTPKAAFYWKLIRAKSTSVLLLLLLCVHFQSTATDLKRSERVSHLPFCSFALTLRRDRFWIPPKIHRERKKRKQASLSVAFSFFCQAKNNWSLVAAQCSSSSSILIFSQNFHENWIFSNLQKKRGKKMKKNEEPKNKVIFSNSFSLPLFYFFLMPV